MIVNSLFYYLVLIISHFFLEKHVILVLKFGLEFKYELRNTKNILQKLWRSKHNHFKEKVNWKQNCLALFDNDFVFSGFESHACFPIKK